MKLEHWQDYLANLSSALRGVEVTDHAEGQLPVDKGVRRWVDLTHDAHRLGNHVYFVGNGGSAAIAGHMAEDACKNAGIRAHALNDSSLLTAIGNDLAFDQVFALPLSRLALKGDMLISISSSGNSPNIVCAIETARSLGLLIVTLSGKRSDNRSRAMGDLNLYVPAQRYGWVECAHQVVLHHWLDQYLNLYGQGAL